MIAAGPNPPPGGADDSALLDRLINAGERLPNGVRERILELDRIVAAPALIRILETDALAEDDAPGDGYGPIHALELLQAFGAAEAIEPMLRVLARCDALEILYSKLILALRSLGAPVLEPALAAHAATDTDDRRMAVEDVLSGLGVRDDRVLAILLKALDREPAFGAGLLAKYGDPAVLPLLETAFDASEVDPRGGLLANDVVIELKWAIEQLGGELSAARARKFEAARAALRATAPSQRSAPDGDEGGTDEGVGDDLDADQDHAQERERILERFAASPYAADAPGHGWIGLMLEYAAEYLDTPLGDLEGDALDEIVFEIFPRKVSCEPDAAPEAVRSLRAFWTFARDVLAHPHAEECLKVLGDDAARRLERELADPSNFGLAKSFVMTGDVPSFRGRLDGYRRSPDGSSADKRQKKKLRNLRKQAQRRNRR